MLSRKKLRNSPTHQVALAGAGAIAVVHSLAASSAGMKIRSVASRGGSSARHLAGNLDARKVALDALPDGAEVLIVATPPDSHEKFTLQGLAGGVTVLIEKPLTTTLTSADRIVAAAGRPNSPRVRVAENLLHSPVWLAAMDRRRTMGSLGHLSAITVQPPPEWGHFLKPLTAGGVLFDLGPHPIALVLGLAGEAPVGVSASLGSLRDDGADDLAELEIRFASGLVARLEVSWRLGLNPDGSTTPGTEAQWSIQAASSDAVLRLEMSPEPIVEFNGDPLPVALRHEVADPRLETLGYVDQLLDLVGPAGAPGQTVEDARMILEVICAAYASAGQNSEEVPLPFAGNRDLTPMQLWLGD